MCDEDKLKKIVDDVVKAVLSASNNVDSIILYGSQARGDSSIDTYYSNKSIKAPIAMGSLTKEELDAEIAKGLDDIRNGRIFTAEEVSSEMEKDFGICFIRI